LLGVLIASIKCADEQDVSEHVWAYLRKKDSRGSAVLHFRNDSREPLTVDTIEFKNMDFKPWCGLLAKSSVTLGAKGVWEEKVKAMVKIALLKESYFNGACDGAFGKVDSILTSIYQISGPSQIDSCVDIAEDDDDIIHVESAKNGKKTKSNVRGISSQHVATLRETLQGIWPTVQDCKVDSSVYYRGRVLVGYYQGAHACGSPPCPSAKDDSMKIWARLAKSNENGERSGRVEYLFKDDKVANLRSGNFIDNVEFDKPFQLAHCNKLDGENENKVQQACRDYCIKVALVDVGYVDGTEICATNKVSLAPIVKMISEDVEAEDESAAQSKRHSSIDSVISSTERTLTTPPASFNYTDQRGPQDRLGPFRTSPERIHSIHLSESATLLPGSFQKSTSPVSGDQRHDRLQNTPTTTESSRLAHGHIENAKAALRKSPKTATTVSNESQTVSMQTPTAIRLPQYPLTKQPTCTVPAKRPLARISSVEPSPTPTHPASDVSPPKRPTLEVTYKRNSKLDQLLSFAKQVLTLQARIHQLEANLKAKDEAADLRIQTALNDMAQEREKDVQRLNQYIAAQAAQKETQLKDLREQVATWKKRYGDEAERFETYRAEAEPRLRDLGEVEAVADAIFGMREGEAKL
jgi:hypothetical protein